MGQITSPCDTMVEWALVKSQIGVRIPVEAIFSTLVTAGVTQMPSTNTHSLTPVTCVPQKPSCRSVYVKKQE